MKSVILYIYNIYLVTVHCLYKGKKYKVNEQWKDGKMGLKCIKHGDKLKIMAIGM